MEAVTREIRYTRFGRTQARPGPTAAASGARPVTRQSAAMPPPANRGQAEFSRSLPPTTSPSGRKAT
jgi:hypothetical protein